MSDLSRRKMLQAGVAGTAVFSSGGAFAEPTSSLNEKTAMPASMPTKITPFLTFQGNADEAVKYYVGLFDDAEIEAITHYKPEECDEQCEVIKPGMVKHTTFRIADMRVMAIDSPIKHEWTFSPAVSLFVETDIDGVERYFNKLSKGGRVFMPLDEYPFSKRFAWVEDKFGVSWQLTAGI